MKTHIVELIETWDRRGTGEKKNPIRMVHQLWTKSGKLVVEQPTEWDTEPCIYMDSLEESNDK